MVSEHLLQLKNAELKAAAHAAWKAGKIINEAYYRSYSIREKGIGDLVSEVDIKADKIITEFLTAQYPDYGVISEELNPHANMAGTHWIIDPLDATSAFIYQVGELSSVMIALIKDGDIHLSLIYFPMRRTWYYAIKGRGAYCNSLRMRAKEEMSLNQAWVDINQYGDSTFETDIVKILRMRLRSREGARLVTSLVPHSGIAMSLIEQKNVSRLSAVVHDNNPQKIKQAPWDVASPQLIVEEAGGVFLNHSGYRYNYAEPGPIIIAGSKTLAQEIINLIR